MEHVMRRSKQQLNHEECLAILKRNTSGVLSLLGEDGYPYGVPLSYTLSDGAIVFHGAITGHKIEAIGNCDKASFCVIDQDEIVPEKFTTNYRSVIVFGKVRVLSDPEEIFAKVKAVGDKYSGAHMANMDQAIRAKMKAMAVIELEIERLTGKQGRGLVQDKS